jgi:GGDEF domain-containing protein
LTVRILSKHGLGSQSFCLELSERHKITDEDTLARVVAEYRRQGIAIAIDDFGVGHSGLRFLHRAQPTLVKVDRFFVSDIDRDARKRSIARHVVSVAHSLGIMVVAEGIETEAEFSACRDIAFDYAQGFLIARPELDPEKIQGRYVAIEDMAGADRRRNRRKPGFVEDNLQRVEPLRDTTPLIEVVAAFQRHIDRTFLPVVDAVGWPVGIVLEADLKVFTYSPFGRDLLANRASRRSARDVMVRRPVADVTMDADSLLEVFTSEANDQGILISRDMRYLGILGAPALLRVVNETNLLNARDQNPLSRLPGNNRIYAYVSNAIEDAAVDYVFAYVDFDAFKPFNDLYGFRQGDRIIVMFAELAGKLALKGDRFVGHIGGDDFFVGFRGCDPADAEAEIRTLLAEFATCAESFYDAPTRMRGHIVAKDRHGEPRVYPLLTASAVMIRLAPGRLVTTLDDVAQAIAEAKPASKTDPTHLAWARLPEAV